MKKPANGFIFCTSSLLVLLVSCSLFAQVGTTSLHGTVLDKSGAVIASAKLKIVKTDQGIAYESTSSERGEYQFLSLAPGSYSLLVEADGFRKFEQRDIELLVNNPATVNVTLEVGSTTQTVEVLAQAAAINTTDASLGVAFNNQQVKKLPMESRNVPDLLTLQAGVVYIGNNPNIDTNVDTRSGAVNGARSDQSNVTLDGIRGEQSSRQCVHFRSPRDLGFSRRISCNHDKLQRRSGRHGGRPGFASDKEWNQ
jgi:hypothetical protein